MATLTTAPTWKFTKYTADINKMSLRAVFAASIECYKRLAKYNYRYHYYEFKIAVEPDRKKRAVFQSLSRQSLNKIRFYADKLEYLDARAADFGIELEENIDSLRKQYAHYRHTERDAVAIISEE